jgi:hypothetical protein
MSLEWKNDLQAAFTDLQSATFPGTTDDQALRHLKDARENLTAAIEKLEEEL